MKRLLSPIAMGWLMALCCAAASGQPRCIVKVELVNHNRYAYQTAEECGRFFHSVPWGNWGVNSNLGRRLDTDQFQGWRQPCTNTKVEWNSCSERSRYRFPGYLNFPSLQAAYPYPANGYPFADPFAWNDSVPPQGFAYNVDQFSPCGPNVYGSVQLSLAVSAQKDLNGDGIADAGGCADLNGQPLKVQRNFMSVYELDAPDSDDLIQSLYFPDLEVILHCTPGRCVPASDADLNGSPDDLNDLASPYYQWPILYQDHRDVICRPSDSRVPCKRIDATIRIGSASGYYFSF
jgi:hypothetical protein